MTVEGRGGDHTTLLTKKLKCLIGYQGYTLELIPNQFLVKFYPILVKIMFSNFKTERFLHHLQYADRLSGSSYGLDQIKFGGVSEAVYGLKSSPKFVTNRRFSRVLQSVITGSSSGLDHIKFGGVSEALYGLKSSPKFVTSRRFSRLIQSVITGPSYGSDQIKFGKNLRA